MTLRLSLPLVLLLLIAPACGGGGGGGNDLPTFILPVDFIHTVTAENAIGTSTVIENPLTYGRPDLILLVTQNRTVGGTPSLANRSPVGVVYDDRGGAAPPYGRWLIANLDTGAEPTMRPDMAFNVSIIQPGRDAFVHEVTRIGSNPHITHMSSSPGPLHGSRDTRVFVTQRLSRADGSFGAINRDAIRTHFTSSNWAIVNMNGGTIPVGACFNVVMLPQTPDVDQFNTMSTAAIVWYDEPLTENAIVHITQGPADTRGRNDRDVALRYSSSRGEWGVSNIDGSLVHQYATFKILIRRR
ncbi:MAG: hypothetical protein QNJ98_11870 [Planctomycetota bacterium]|nr:hypothetical protein [Planctomycetota bacterium]